MKIITALKDNAVIVLLFFIKDAYEFINWINGTNMQPIDFVDLGIKIFLAGLVISYSVRVKRQETSLKILNEISKTRLRNMYLAGLQTTQADENRMMEGYLNHEKQQVRLALTRVLKKQTSEQINKQMDELYR